MPKFCLNAFTNCSDPSREMEFNQWYSHTHLPDLSKTSGFVTARRFTNPAAGAEQARYWAQYEFEHDNPAECTFEFLTLALGAYAAGRHIDCITSAQAGPGGLWQFVDPQRFTALDENVMNYPKEPSTEITQAINSFQNKVML